MLENRYAVVMEMRVVVMEMMEMVVVVVVVRTANRAVGRSRGDTRERKKTLRQDGRSSGYP